MKQIYLNWVQMRAAPRKNRKLQTSINNYCLLLELGQIPDHCIGFHKAALPHLAGCLFATSEFEKFHAVFRLLQDQDIFKENIDLVAKSILKAPKLMEFLFHKSSFDILLFALNELLVQLQNRRTERDKGWKLFSDLFITTLISQRENKEHKIELNQFLDIAWKQNIDLITPHPDFSSQLLFFDKFLRAQKFNVSTLSANSLYRIILRITQIPDYRALNVTLITLASTYHRWKDDPDYQSIFPMLAKVSLPFLKQGHIQDAHNHMLSLIRATEQDLSEPELITQMLDVFVEILKSKEMGTPFFWNYYVYSVAKLNPETQQDLFFHQITHINLLIKDDIPAFIYMELIDSTVAISVQKMFIFNDERLETVEHIVRQSIHCNSSPKLMFDQFQQLFESLKQKDALKLTRDRFIHIASYILPPTQLMELKVSPDQIATMLENKCRYYLLSRNNNSFILGLYYFGQFQQFVTESLDRDDLKLFGSFVFLLAAALVKTYSDNVVKSLEFNMLPKYLNQMEETRKDHPQSLTSPFHVIAAMQSLVESMIHMEYREMKIYKFIRSTYIGFLKQLFLSTAQDDYEQALDLWSKGIEMLGYYPQVPLPGSGQLERHPFVGFVLLPFQEIILNSKDSGDFPLLFHKLGVVAEHMVQNQPDVDLAIKAACIQNMIQLLNKSHRNFITCKKELTSTHKKLQRYLSDLTGEVL